MKKERKSPRLLTKREVRFIKKAASKRRKHTAVFLASMFGCSASHVRNIWRGLHWKDI